MSQARDKKRKKKKKGRIVVFITFDWSGLALTTDTPGKVIYKKDISLTCR